MPDITMCTGTFCPIKETCYRFTAVPSSYRQSYFLHIPYDSKEKKCDHFVKNKGK